MQKVLGHLRQGLEKAKEVVEVSLSFSSKIQHILFCWFVRISQTPCATG